MGLEVKYLGPWDSGGWNPKYVDRPQYQNISRIRDQNRQGWRIHEFWIGRCCSIVVLVERVGALRSIGRISRKVVYLVLSSRWASWSVLGIVRPIQSASQLCTSPGRVAGFHLPVDRRQENSLSKESQDRVDQVSPPVSTQKDFAVALGDREIQWIGQHPHRNKGLSHL